MPKDLRDKFLSESDERLFGYKPSRWTEEEKANFKEWYVRHRLSEHFESEEEEEEEEAKNGSGGGKNVDLALIEEEQRIDPDGVRRRRSTDVCDT